MLKGSIDAVHNGFCYGWAMDEDIAGSVDVEVFIDGHSIGRTRADGHRADLAIAGLRDGRLAFCVAVPEALRDGCHHLIEARTVDGRAIATRDAVQVVPKLTVDEFDRHAAWIDGDDDAFVHGLDALNKSGKIDVADESKLRHFRRHGWLKLDQAVPHTLIDQLLENVESAWQDLPPQLVQKRGLAAPVRMSEMANSPDFRGSSVRYLDFHNTSEAAAEIMMLPAVLRFAELCFGEKVAAMQTLLFENGSQQASHQDFAFVHSLRPACLMGSWVALEDAHVDAGPLFYFDRSHREVPKYVFDDGSILAEGSGEHVREFERYLETTCRSKGLDRLIFTPRKGDVLIWHSALVHGGMPRNDPALTRKSIVSHYTTQTAYPYDRRSPNDPPSVIERNGGIYYAMRSEQHVEGRYKLASRTN